MFKTTSIATVCREQIILYKMINQFLKNIALFNPSVTPIRNELDEKTRSIKNKVTQQKVS